MNIFFVKNGFKHYLIIILIVVLIPVVNSPVQKFKKSKKTKKITDMFLFQFYTAK